MNSPSETAKIVSDLRRLESSGGGGAPEDIERYLRSTLARYPHGTRLPLLEKLVSEFGDIQQKPVTRDEGALSVEMHELIGRFLGAVAGNDSLSARELADKFSGSLETLFNSVNQIVSVINVTLLGEHQELETIRKVIGSNLKGDTDYAAIKKYLDRIQSAFLIAHDAFQAAARVVIGEILTELDPAAIAKSKSSGLKFGPLRKAELYELYEEKYARCQRWFESEQFPERLLREFENCCRSKYTSPTR